MRFTPLLALLLAGSPAAFAVPASPSAQLFAERMALLGGDGKCHLLSAGARSALIATTGQARFGALRDGWTSEGLDGVAQRSIAAGSGRDCKDPLLLNAARGAAAGFQGWAKMPSADFKGADRTWSARRTPDLSGWMLAQQLPGGGAFGVLMIKDKGQLALALPVPAAQPASATLFLRNRTIAPKPVIGIPGMATQTGLAARAAPRSLALAQLASARSIDQPEKQPARMLFTFPGSVLNDIAALDPREAVEIELAPTPGAAPQRYFIEVGDLVAARAFLAAKPG